MFVLSGVFVFVFCGLRFIDQGCSFYRESSFSCFGDLRFIDQGCSFYRESLFSCFVVFVLLIRGVRFIGSLRFRVLGSSFY